MDTIPTSLVGNSELFFPVFFHIRNTTEVSEKGVQGVVFIRKRSVRPVFLLSGESGGAVARSGGASRPTPPDYPPPVLMASQIYATLSFVGGPDTAVCHLPIHSL